MKIRKYHDLKYLKSKFIQWLYNKKKPENPWLTPDSIFFLDNWLSDKDVGFEWGSGRSTIWFSERVLKLVSVEHDLEWYEKIKTEIKKLSGEDQLKIDYKYFDIRDDPGKTQYVNSINKISGELFDFVLVDGRIRDLCSLNVVEKIKKGGIIILDNAERYLTNSLNLPESNTDFKINGPNPNWAEFEGIIKNKRKYWTSNGITSTLIIFN